MRRQFEIKSGRMVISDPCYKLNSMVNATIENVKKGKWRADVIKSEDGKVNDFLYAYHIEISNDDELGCIDIKNLYKEENLLPCAFGVDSGQLGFFDYDGYGNSVRCKYLKRQYSEIIEPENQFYSFCCDSTLSKERWGTLPFGVVASSGYGDGFYEVFALKNNEGQFVFFEAVFCMDDFDDEEFD